MTEFPGTTVGSAGLPRLLIGTTTPDEARDLLAHKISDHPPQRTGSKVSPE